MAYNDSQLKLIQEYRPELRFLPVNMDILVMEFLRIYDIYVKPTDVGSWNGWDTIAVLDSFLNRARGGTSVASSIFYSGRSMQISQRSKQGAEDWTTWKKWSLEHEKFEEFKEKRIKEIENYNKLLLEKINSNELKGELNKLLNEYESRENFKKFYNSKKSIIYGILAFLYVITSAAIFSNDNLPLSAYRNAVFMTFPFIGFSVLFVEGIVPNTLLMFFPEPE